MMNAMRKLAVVLALVGAGGGGCYGAVGYGGQLHIRANPIAVAAAAITVAAVVAVASQPPIVAEVEYYDYGENPGNVWVNGRYAYVNNQWVWYAGHWQPEREGQYWIQGAWEPRGNQWVWIDGHWEGPHNGYTYVDGYWDDRGNGYTWIAGTWEVERPGHVYVGGSWTTYNGRRTWSRGRWERDDGRAEWGRYRTRGRIRGRY